MQFLEKIGRKHILVGIVVLIIAIPLTLYLVRQQQILRSRADLGGVSVAMNPSQGDKQVGREFSADLMVNNIGRAAATADPLTGIDVTLTFNLDVYEAVTFTPNTLAIETDVQNTHRPAQSNPCDRTVVTGTVCTFHFLGINTTRIVTADNQGNLKIGTFTFRPRLITDVSPAIGDITLESVQIVGSRIEGLLTITPTTPATIANFRIVGVSSPTPTGPITPTPTPTTGATTCTCQTNNTCSAPCAANQSTNRLTGISHYEAQMFCLRESGLEERQSSPPSIADKLDYCQRASRPRGDADGRADSRNCQINRQDYLFYLSSVIRARIPSGVNADFDGNGRVSPDDLSIWERGRCDNI